MVRRRSGVRARTLHSLCRGPGHAILESIVVIRPTGGNETLVRGIASHSISAPFNTLLNEISPGRKVGLATSMSTSVGRS